MNNQIKEKICPKCNNSFPQNNSFFKYKKNKPTYCRTCWNKHYKKSKQYHSTNNTPQLSTTTITHIHTPKSQSRKIKEKQTKKRRIQKCRSIVENHLKSNHCQDCNETDWIVLEFDHQNPNLKFADISDLMAKGRLNRLIEEIKKCDVVCANCHNKRTYKMNRSWRTNS